MYTLQLNPLIKPDEVEPKINSIHREVLQGLHKPAKQLPAKLFYDKVGSHLFDQICELDEYYVTRTETAIMQEYVGGMASRIGPRCLLVEYGSGSSKKTRFLLDQLQDLAAYIAIDISKEHLLRSTANLAVAYPGLEVIPLCADYTSPFALPAINKSVLATVAYFPGSTIGNFYPEEAVNFLKRIAKAVGPSGRLLIGVDLKKNPKVLHAAYNDRAGVTAAFNLNMLTHINRELGANFQIDQFLHYAFYNAPLGRIEMHLVSCQDQAIHIGNAKIFLRAGESILTEVSYKYTPAEFAKLAAQAGFKVSQVWMDKEQQFSVQYLIAG